MSKVFCCVTSRTDKVMRLYLDSNERIQKELDIAKIVRSIRNTKVFIRSKLMDRRTKMLVEHNDKNVINLDSSLDEI